MLADMHENFASSGLGPDTILAALVDCFEVGLFTGSRLSEWAQDYYHDKLDSYKRDERDDTTAFPVRDFRFKSVSHMRKIALEASKNTIPMTKCGTTYRSQ